MRKNRRIPKRMSVMATTSMRFGAIVVLFFVMVIMYMLSDSSCTQLLKTKGELERELAKLEKTRTQESSRWDEMMSAEWMESALLRHGLKMAIPRPDQIVRMKSNGVPYPGQASVARAKQHNLGNSAKNFPATGKRRIRR